MKMSEFSDFCNMLREESGMTIYHIAKVSGMERTALNRMLNGKRFPKYEDVDLFCEVLRASEKEKEHLRELYLMEKMGKNHYENYKYIQNLLHKLDQGEEYPMPFCKTAEWDTRGKEKIFAKGKGEVKELICHVLERQYRQNNTMEMYTNFPVHEDVLPITVNFYERKYGKEIPLCHFHILNVNPKKYYDVDCNLKVLSFSLMCLFSGKRNYIPYYTYSQLMLNDLELQFMPYYLVTDCQVLLISSDFRQGILLNDPDMVLFYQERMITIRNQMSRLFQIDTDPDGEKMGIWGKWEEESACSRDDSGQESQRLNVKLYEKGVVISKEESAGSTISVMVSESSLCEAFHDFFTYRNELAEIEERKMEEKRGAH